MTRDSLVHTVREISERVAEPIADEVDRDGRFPVEVVAELRRSGAFGALLGPEYDGPDSPLAEAGLAVSALTQHCGSSGLILAMHWIQSACLIRHGSRTALELAAPRLRSGELLLASANSEVGLDGALRRSKCALVPTADGFQLEKQAATLSYGEYADGVLATARRSEDSPPSDQVFAICLAPKMSVEPLGEWDAMGMRGTRSRPCLLKAELRPELVIEDYPDVFLRTSQGVSAGLLSSVWLGLAEAAARRAHAKVRAHARTLGPRAAGSAPPIGAVRLAELSVQLHMLREVVAGGLAYYDRVKDTDEVATMPFANRMGNLKIAASTLLGEITRSALQICGISAYKNDSAGSLARICRDAAAAPLMINNDRTLTSIAQVLMGCKEI